MLNRNLGSPQFIRSRCVSSIFGRFAISCDRSGVVSSLLRQVLGYQCVVSYLLPSYGAFSGHLAYSGIVILFGKGDNFDLFALAEAELIRSDFVSSDEPSTALPSVVLW